MVPADLFLQGALLQPHPGLDLGLEVGHIDILCPNSLYSFRAANIKLTLDFTDI